MAGIAFFDRPAQGRLDHAIGGERLMKVDTVEGMFLLKVFKKFPTV